MLPFKHCWAPLLLIAVCLAAHACADENSHTLSAAQASLQVRDGYRVEAVASEPLVVDPVSARLDHLGRLWVVEMPDYPTGPPDPTRPNGRIKILTDHDHDGRYDQAAIFAEGLMFATGVQPYEDGAIVTVAGKIVQMRDRDGDLVADETVVLFEGFAELNEQLRANHPTLGPDGRIYVAGGLRGGLIRAVDPRFPPQEKPLDIRDRDFCFDPNGGWWGAVTGKSQFGVTIDDFGRRLGCSNRNPAMFAALPLEAIERDPLLAARDAIADVALAGEQSTVISRAQAWTTSNLHSGQFSAACGVFAPGISDERGEWLLACEPTAYLVQRQRVNRQGSLWTSRREPGQAEFLSSSDSWFRPVDATAGPAQSVLIVDMTRAVIEHPDFMPVELKTRPDQRDGNALGRIWKVTPENDDSSASTLTSSDAALTWMESSSPWQRQMASQYFLEHDESASKQLAGLVNSSDASPRARARAAFLLRRRGELTNDQIRAMMQADDARLRRLAVRLASDRDELLTDVLALANDEDMAVRLAVALNAGAGETASEARIEALTTIAQAEDDVWIRRSLSSVQIDLAPDLAKRLVAADRADSGLLSHLVQRVAIASPEIAATVVATHCDADPEASDLDAASADVLAAWVTGVKRSRRSVQKTLAQLPAESKQVLMSAFRRAGATAVNASAKPTLRASCLQLSVDVSEPPEDLRPLLAEQSPSVLRVAAFPIALRQHRDWTQSYLLENVSGMSASLRDAAVRACVRSAEDTKWLLTMISDEKLPRTMIDPSTAKRLRQHSNEAVKRLAGELLQSDPNRARVLQAYASASKNLGDPETGKKLFVEHCSACHRIDGVGTNVGPDISDTRTKTPEALLASILDPNAAIDSAFIQYNVLTVDGRVVSGLLVDETSDAVTLQQKGGERVAVTRDEIELLRAPGVSLMPEGFEQTIDVTAMSHLVSYLKNWRYLQTRIPGTLPQTP